MGLSSVLDLHSTSINKTEYTNTLFNIFNAHDDNPWILKTYIYIILLSPRCGCGFPYKQYGRTHSTFSMNEIQKSKKYSQFDSYNLSGQMHRYHIVNQLYWTDFSEILNKKVHIYLLNRCFKWSSNPTRLMSMSLITLKHIGWVVKVPTGRQSISWCHSLRWVTIYSNNI